MQPGQMLCQQQCLQLSSLPKRINRFRWWGIQKSNDKTRKGTETYCQFCSSGGPHTCSQPLMPAQRININIYSAQMIINNEPPTLNSFYTTQSTNPLFPTAVSFFCRSVVLAWTKAKSQLYKSFFIADRLLLSSSRTPIKMQEGLPATRPTAGKLSTKRSGDTNPVHQYNPFQ